MVERHQPHQPNSMTAMAMVNGFGSEGEMGWGVGWWWRRLRTVAFCWLLQAAVEIASKMMTPHFSERVGEGHCCDVFGSLQLHLCQKSWT